MKLFEFENTDCINIVTVDASERYECSLAANVCETFAMMNKPCMCIAVMPIKIGEPYYNATVNLDQIDTAQCAIVRLENNLYKDVCDVVFRIIYIGIYGRYYRKSRVGVYCVGIGKLCAF